MTSRDEQPTPAASDLSAREAALSAAKGDLQKRIMAVTERELAADAGFELRTEAATAALLARHHALLEELKEVQAKIARERSQALIDLETQLNQERKTRQGLLDAELAAERNRAEQERTRLLEAIQDREKALQGREARLDEAEEDYQRREARLAYASEALEGRLVEIKAQAEAQAEDRVQALQRDVDRRRRDHADQQDLLADRDRELDELRQMFARYGESPEAMKQALDLANASVRELTKALAERPLPVTPSERDLLAEAQEAQRLWIVERGRLHRELGTLRAKETTWIIGVGQLEAEKDRREALERRNEALLANIQKYASVLDQQRKLHDVPEERAKRLASIEEPYFTEVPPAQSANPDELPWLDGIQAACGAIGMRFPKRLLHAFHTSLKTAELSPLTVLAGASGTGKSELPRLYARFGGLTFLSLPVQPNWDSPQSLFGYFNSVDNRFNATTVLRALVQAQHRPEDSAHPLGLADRMMLVLLDEMNLAHVEQYFSDLLSRLELRRGESRDILLDIDLGAGMAAYPLKLGQNVMWVGTMNEDETTKALSDKVIDRSNMLFFPRPQELHSRAKVTLGEEAPLLARSTWERWIQPSSLLEQNQLAPFKTALETINIHLEPVGRALGHRVWQGVESYLANYPETIAALAIDDPPTQATALTRAMAQAFEDQLVLKVMPKLRGVETSGDARTLCLDPIQRLLGDPELGLGLDEDFHNACRVGFGAFMWNSARYLDRP